jgi:hypothetical protein
MKTIKTIFSILGVTLATISFGQLVSLQEPIEETNLNLSQFMDIDAELLFYLSEYNEESGKVTHWVNHLPANLSMNGSARDRNPSLMSRTYFAKDIEVTYESIPVIEDWMTVPFEDGFLEPGLNIEPWMSVPFENILNEEEMEFESWMTTSWI